MMLNDINLNVCGVRGDNLPIIQNGLLFSNFFLVTVYFRQIYDIVKSSIQRTMLLKRRRSSSSIVTMSIFLSRFDYRILFCLKKTIFNYILCGTIEHGPLKQTSSQFYNSTTAMSIHNGNKNYCPFLLTEYEVVIIFMDTLHLTPQ